MVTEYGVVEIEINGLSYRIPSRVYNEWRERYENTGDVILTLEDETVLEHRGDSDTFPSLPTFRFVSSPNGVVLEVDGASKDEPYVAVRMAYEKWLRDYKPLFPDTKIFNLPLSDSGEVMVLEAFRWEDSGRMPVFRVV